MATTIFELVATLGLDNSGFLTGLNIAGNMMHAFASSVVDFGKDVMRTGMGFDSAMSSVQAVLGREEGTVENMAKLRAYALDQARTSIFTAEETANAYYYMGMAGWKAEQMSAGLPAVMSLAEASGEDLAMTSDIVTDSLTAFGKGADYAQTYVDILAQAATNSNTNVAMMGETFKYAAPLAGAMGFSVEDTAVAIGLMANAGIKGSQAGTTLRRVFSAMTGPIDIAGQNLGKVTIQTTNADGSMRDLSDIVTELRGAFAQLTESEKTHAAETIAGKYAMSGFLAMMNATEEDVNNLTVAIDNATGAAQTMSEVRLDNLEGDIIKMNSALDILKVAIFDDVKDPMRGLVQEGTEGLNRVTEAIKEEGVIGGLRQLTTELRNLKENEEFQEFAKNAGEALGELISFVTDEFGPQLMDTAFGLGSTFAGGILDKVQGSFLGTLIPSFLQPRIKEDDMATYGGLELPVKVLTEIDPAQLAASIEEAATYGYYSVDIGNGTYISKDEAQRLYNDLVNEVFTHAGTDGGAVMGNNAVNSMTDTTGIMQSILISMFSNSGTTGGYEMGQNATNEVNNAADGMKDDLSTALGGAGTDAGSDIVSGIKNALTLTKFTIGITGVVSSIVDSFKTHKNASAMSSGRIFTRPTVFGYADNAFQVAGDAGPEAVVGVNSLHAMIAGAVSSAMAGQEVVVPRDTGRDIHIHLMLDRQEFARAVYKANNEQTQLVGVNLSGVSG